MKVRSIVLEMKCSESPPIKQCCDQKGPKKQEKKVVENGPCFIRSRLNIDPKNKMLSKKKNKCIHFP